MNRDQYTDSKIGQVIEILQTIEVDGEMMEEIITHVGMKNQMLRQLVLKASWNNLNHLIEEKGELQ